MPGPATKLSTVTYVDFAGLVNGRDVGGCRADGGRVRSGVLYRSETPQLMSGADVALARDQLGIERVIDLRGARFGSSGPIAADGRGVSLDFFSLVGPPGSADGSSRDGFLPGLLDRAGVVVGLVLEQMLSVDGATLVHCHTGKDRTGFTIAMILALVGVSDEDIVADYDLSAPVFENMMANLEAVGLGVPESAPAYATHAPSADGMRALLSRLRAEHPSPESYLLNAGVTPELIARARRRLVEPD